MRFVAARWLLGTGMVFAAASAFAVNDWGDMAVISSTMGVGANRICIGEGLRASDIGCPTYAPSITTAGDVSVTGNLSAAKFIGDGAGLTGVVASSGDRIVSGTTSLVAISNTGYISLTQSGVNTGWFNPQTGFVTIGVSSTGRISGTTGYFSGNVGVGTSSPGGRFEVNQGGSSALNGISLLSGASAAYANYSLGRVGTEARFAVVAANNNFTQGSVSGDIVIQNSNGTKLHLTSRDYSSPPDVTLSQGNVGIGTNNPQAQLQIGSNLNVFSPTGTNAAFSNNIYYSGGWKYNTTNYAAMMYSDAANGDTTFYTAPSGAAGTTAIITPRLTISNGGNVGIGTISPNAKLEVSGTISATNLVINGQTITGGASGDRITSGTSSVVVNSATSTISFSTAGSQRMTIDGSGNVGIGTVSPQFPLHITADLPYIEFDRASAMRGLIGVANGSGVTFTTSSANDMVIRSQANILLGSSQYEYLRIASSGNIGIGTSTPARTLDVSGTAQIASSTAIGMTATPSATLDVSGTLKIAGTGSEGCNGNTLGMFRRNPTTGAIQVCASR